MHLGELVGGDNRKEEQITRQQIRLELVSKGSLRGQEGKDFSRSLTCQKLLKRASSQIQQINLKS